MNIYQIKSATEKTAPYFFCRRTMRFFGQTLRSFRVTKREDGKYDVIAPRKVGERTHGNTHRVYNPENNKLESPTS